jgi:hypothetical protein
VTHVLGADILVKSEYPMMWTCIIGGTYVFMPHQMSKIIKKLPLKKEKKNQEPKIGGG